MRATTSAAPLLLGALPGAYGVAATTFVRVPEDLAYAEAEARCTQIGAAIASIHSAAENELARTACGNSACWLGLAETGGDAGTAGANQTWLWQDPLSPAAYTNWAAGEPDNAGGVDQRNAIFSRRGWTGVGRNSPLTCIFFLAERSQIRIQPQIDILTQEEGMHLLDLLFVAAQPPVRSVLCPCPTARPTFLVLMMTVL